MKYGRQGWGVALVMLNIRLEQPSAFSLSGERDNAASAERPQ
jgi:hypothetical protein